MVSGSSSVAVPATVYLDTGLVAAAMLQGALHHPASQEFCKVLVGASSRVYFSNLLRIELLQALVSIGTDPTQLTGRVRRRYALHRWGDNSPTRLDWLQHGMELLEQFLDQFAEVSEAAIAPGIIDAAIPLMARYKLRSYDALHIATAEALGVSHLATCDADYLRVGSDALVTVLLIRDASLHSPSTDR